MEVEWQSKGRHWRAVVAGEEVAHFTQPTFSRRTRVQIGEDSWIFTRRWGRPAGSPEHDPASLTARRVSWFSSDREVVTPRGAWLLRFPGYFGRTVEVWQQGLRFGEIRSASWWRGLPVLVRLGEGLPLVDAVWLSWHGLDMRWNRESSGAGGGGGGDGGGG